MSNVILTLQYPKGLRGIPIATSTNLELLQYFKEVVLEEWQHRIEGADDEVEALMHRLEYERLLKVLSFLIPRSGEDELKEEGRWEDE